MAVCGWKFSGVALVHSQECQMLRTSCKEKPNQWSEHFTSLLKFLSSIFNEALNEVFRPTQPRTAGNKTAQALLTVLWILQRRAAGTCGTSGQRAPPGLTKAWLFADIKDKQMIPQEFKHAEIQLYKKSRAQALENGAFIHFLQGKRNFCLCWNNGQQTEGLAWLRSS